MNDTEIRDLFFKNSLFNSNNLDKNTVVIEELGINHGKCRADIAMLDNHFIGYEIKSNSDSLRRLNDQISAYNSIFDKIYILIGNRHKKSIFNTIPTWWGIIVIDELSKEPTLNILRSARLNKNIDPISIARLLWRNEVTEILEQNEISKHVLRKPKAELYEYLVNILTISELKQKIKFYFSQRNNWRCHELIFQYDDLCQPSST